MRCLYCDNGCPFVGKVSDVVAHEMECAYSKIDMSPEGKRANGHSEWQCPT